MENLNVWGKIYAPIKNKGKVKSIKMVMKVL